MAAAMRPRVIFDMDGVLFTYNSPKEIGGTSAIYRRNYFLRLSVQTAIKKMAMRLKAEGADLWVCSKVLSKSENPWAEKEKREALLRDYPFISNICFVPMDGNKAKSLPFKIDSNCILYDDEVGNCIDWTKAGGKAIQVVHKNVNQVWEGNKLFI